MNTLDPKFIFDIISLCGSVGWIIVTLTIKNSLKDIQITQARDRAEVLAAQVQVKEELMLAQAKSQGELNDNHAKSREELKVHIAEDLLKFDNITHNLIKIDTKLDNLTNMVIAKRP